jgi:hypothetical protein
MLSLRTHAIISAAIFATIVGLAMIDNALHYGGVVQGGPGLRRTSMVVFIGLILALWFSVIPVMVKLVLGFQVWMGNGGHPVIAALVARERIIIFAFWAFYAFGLLILAPKAISDGMFD